MSTENKKKKTRIKVNNVRNLIVILTCILSIVFYIFYVISSLSKINYGQLIFTATCLLLALIAFSVSIMIDEKRKTLTYGIASSFIALLMIVNLGINFNFINLPSLKVLKDYTNNSLVSLLKDADELDFRFEIEKNYEYSDNVKEGDIISQSENPDTKLSDIKKLVVVISSGPNYDKEVFSLTMLTITL